MPTGNRIRGGGLTTDPKTVMYVPEAVWRPMTGMRGKKTKRAGQEADRLGAMSGHRLETDVIGQCYAVRVAAFPARSILDWHSTSWVAAGYARRRFSGIGFPHISQSP